jgi:hypothetical protein
MDSICLSVHNIIKRPYPVKESRYLNVCAAVNAVCDVEPHIPKKKSEKKLDDASDIILSTPIKHERNDTKKSLKDEL